MAMPLRVLLVEDAEDDALLLADELRGAGYAPELERVETAEAMAASLDRQSWDVVIADYTLPRLAAPELADLCLVDLADADGALLRLAAQPLDAEDADAPPRPLRWSRPDARHGPLRVLRSGRAEVLPEVSDAALADLAPDDD